MSHHRMHGTCRVTYSITSAGTGTPGRGRSHGRVGGVHRHVVRPVRIGLGGAPLCPDRPPCRRRCRGNRLLDTYRRLYPSSAHGEVLPLRPDRLAEDFVAAQLTDSSRRELMAKLLANVDPGSDRRAPHVMTARALSLPRRSGSCVVDGSDTSELTAPLAPPTPVGKDDDIKQAS